MKAAIVHLMIINLMAFCMYGIDKTAAIKQKQRIPNKILPGIAVIGIIPTFIDDYDAPGLMRSGR